MSAVDALHDHWDDFERHDAAIKPIPVRSTLLPILAAAQQGELQFVDGAWRHRHRRFACGGVMRLIRSGALKVVPTEAGLATLGEPVVNERREANRADYLRRKASRT